MPISDNIGGAWRQVAKSYSNINGVYREDSKVYDNVAGVWREAYSSRPAFTVETSTGSHSYGAYTPSLGNIWVSADQGNYSKNGSVSVVFTDALSIYSIVANHVPQSSQEMTQTTYLYLDAIDASNSIIEEDRPPYTMYPSRPVKRYRLNISTTGSSWGFYEIHPVFTLPDGSTFDIIS